MNVNDLFKTWVALRVGAAAIVVAFTLAVVAGAPPKPAQAASTGVQYDQLLKIIVSQTTPQPGTFESDWQAAINAQTAASNQATHHGLFGNIMNQLNQAKNAMSVLQTGSATTEYFLNGWERVDDLGMQTATITKPQLHQVIHLDLKNKTYHVDDTTVHPSMETPPPYQPPQPSGSPPPSPQPGTAKVAITVSTTSLGSKVLGGEQTQGYKVAFKIASTQATGSCANGTFETAMIVWDSKYPEPSLASSGSVPVRTHRAAPNPETASFRPGCKPKITTRAHIGPTPPGGRLSMWELVALKAGVATSQGSGSGGFSTLIERGNVHALESSAAGLFEIPAGFTQQTASPTP